MLGMVQVRWGRRGENRAGWHLGACRWGDAAASDKPCSHKREPALPPSRRRRGDSRRCESFIHPSQTGPAPGQASSSPPAAVTASPETSPGRGKNGLSDMMKFSLPREVPKRPKKLAEQEAGRTLSRSSPWSTGHMGATGWGTRWPRPTPFPPQERALLTRLPPARSPTQGLGCHGLRAVLSVTQTVTCPRINAGGEQTPHLLRQTPPPDVAAAEQERATPGTPSATDTAGFSPWRSD